ncbi:MAG TPA: flagellar basal body P-ring formation chaperone FlgA [Rhizomicrobium sp.]|jgi:flagella basal body P-ring formation protein FlgA|nr:flagellar basal body P-ring formation chaperone FlgA [Rhizomicrobium sp.]
MKFASAILAFAALVAAPAMADQATPLARIVVPAHDIARGDTIADSDLSYQMVAPQLVRGGTVTSMNDLDGMEARRFLRAGETVRPDDVRRPILVTKGSTVTMTFDLPGLSVAAVGKAMSEGGLGESVTVVNPVSFRQVIGTVTGPGTVRAGDASILIQQDNQIAAAQPQAAPAAN